MSGVRTVTVQSVHAYTRSDVPWEVETNRAANGATTKGKRFGWRLFHYISSGGMRTFGRTVAQMEASRRQRRFAVFAVVFAVVWAVLYVV